jgi:hypothetical protein
MMVLISRQPRESRRVRAQVLAPPPGKSVRALIVRIDFAKLSSGFLLQPILLPRNPTPPVQVSGPRPLRRKQVSAVDSQNGLRKS